MIRFANVTKHYPSQVRPALHEVNIDIARGEFAFLVGASGSGKSTLLRLVLREDRATTGTDAEDAATRSTCQANTTSLPKMFSPRV